MDDPGLGDDLESLIAARPIEPGRLLIEVTETAAIVNIARGLGTRTVAEFVGDDETVELLRRLGVDYGQGYHLGMPVPVGELLPAAGKRSRRAVHRDSA